MRAFITAFLLLLSACSAGCTQIYQYGNSDSVMIMQSVSGNSATIPLPGLPGLP